MTPSPLLPQTNRQIRNRIFGEVANRNRLIEDAPQLRSSFRQFIRASWHIVEPAYNFLPNWHIDAIGDHLQAVADRQIKNLVINIPPGHAKSLLVAVQWPAWMWIRKTRWETAAAWRGLFCSYAIDLSVRDSIRTRALIESAWYQDMFRPTWALTRRRDALIQNSASGFRMALSVGGRGTGERGDDRICLRGDTLITTDQGDIQIQTIVDRQLPVRVLGSSGRWQDIEAYEVSPGRDMCRLGGANGRHIECTTDHPIWLENKGFRRAIDAIEYLYGDIFMRSLRRGVRPSAGSCGALQENLLFEEMQGSIADWSSEPSVEWRKDDETLPAMLRSIRSQSGRDGAQELLLCGVPLGFSSHLQAMPLLHAEFPWTGVPPKILLDEMRQRRTANEDPRGIERPLYARGLGNPIWAGIYEGGKTLNTPSGRSSVRDLPPSGPADASASDSPYRWIEGLSCSVESGEPLWHVPSKGSHEEGDQQGWHEKVRVTSFDRCGTPDRVFNLRVGPDHDYFANGFLVHNCDDPLNVNNQHSEVTRKEIIRWWDRTMSSRMNNLEVGASVIIMQRLHEDDLSGHCIAKGNYESLVLPSEFDQSRRAKTFITFRGTRQPFFEDPRTAQGELLFPALFPKSVLEQAKLDLASYGYAGQHQQLPAPESGGIFKRDMFQRYKEAPLELDTVMCIWDCAFKDSSTNDYVAGVVGAFAGARCYILDLVKAHLSFDGTENAIKDLRNKWNVPRYSFGGPGGGAETELQIQPRKYVEPWAPFYQASVAGIGIEDAANGPAIISRLRKVIPGVIPLPTEGGKFARAWSTQPTVEAGQIYIPEDAPWAGDFINSLATFPNAKHDDDVDAFTHLLAYARRTMAWNGLIEYYKREQGHVDTKKSEAEVMNEASKQAQIGNLKKPLTAPDGSKCPECESAAIGKVGAQLRCNQCGHQWGGPQIHKPAVIPARGGMKK